MIRVVFHVHSNYSSDSNLRLEKIAETCRRKNINVAILADHNNLAPAKTINGVRIISGEEVKTDQGEIIGLFLNNKIQQGLSPKETVKKIKEQEGLIIVPHPFDRFRQEVIKKEALIDIIDDVDIIEVFNARNVLEMDNKRAEDLAKRYNKIKIVGSDAHLSCEIGNTYMEMEDFSGAAEFLKSLRKARFYTKKASIYVHLISKIIKILKKRGLFTN